MAPEKVGLPRPGTGELAGCGPRQRLPRPPAQPGPGGRGGLLTLQREEQQRRQTAARGSHPGAAGSAPATRPAPRCGGGGAGRALGALGTARSSPTRRPASLRPAVLGPPGTQASQVQLPRRPALAGLAPSATATSRCPRTRRPSAPPGEPLPPTPARLLPQQPASPARSPGQPRLQRDAWRPTRRAIAARSWRSPATCARCPPLPARVGGAGSPEAVVLLAPSRGPCRALNRSLDRWCQFSSPESSWRDFSTVFDRTSKSLFCCSFQMTSIWPFHFLVVLSSVT